jgi:quercetin dioxygenase-like cupin family protein
MQLRGASEAEAKRIVESWGSLNWLASKAIGNAEGLTLGHVIVKKGCANPAHRHNHSEEVLYLLRGRLDHRIGEERIIVNAGDTITIPPGVGHQAINIGDQDAEMIVAYPTGARDFVAEEKN